MRSRVAETLKQEQRERFARMTYEERTALATRLGEEWLADTMLRHNLDRQGAMELLRQSRRAGRKPSASWTAAVLVELIVAAFDAIDIRELMPLQIARLVVGQIVRQ